MAKFTDKVIVVTGASSGLGATLALECAKEGARLALRARNREKLEEVARGCEGVGGEALVVVGDVTLPEDGKRLLAETVDRFGGLDYLVANAGVSMWTNFAEVEDPSLYRKLMEVNYLGAVYCLHPALNYLMQSGGIFVAISSIQGKVGVPLHTGYSASKHALQGFCDALRMEVEENGVGAMGESSRKHSAESVTLEETAQAIIEGLLARKRELYIPNKLKLLVGAKALWPQLADSVIKGKVHREDQ